MATRRHGERTVFLPWERQGGLVRRLGLGRIRVAAAVLLGVLVLGMLGHREKKLARERSTRATLLVVRRGIDAYRADHEGKCPKGSFDELVSRGYLAQLPVDAWGNPVRLSCPSRRPDKPYDLVSDGPDGEPLGLDRVELRNTGRARALALRNHES